MSATSVLAAGCLVAAAVAVTLPARGRLARRRLASLTRRGGPRSSADRTTRRPGQHPPLWTLVACCVVVAVGAAAAAGGPVAALAVAAYCGVAVRLRYRWRADRAAARSRTRALDGLYSLAADLRAGAPASESSIVAGSGRLTGLVEALRRMADHTGAPLADLLERVAADARATDRIAAVAAAQAAGAQATAWLLAALPAGGLALGYTIGADPLRVLLRTPLGAACTVGAIVLQVAGLAWADRLIRPGPVDAQTRQHNARAGRFGTRARRPQARGPEARAGRLAARGAR